MLVVAGAEAEAESRSQGAGPVRDFPIGLTKDLLEPPTPLHFASAAEGRASGATRGPRPQHAPSSPSSRSPRHIRAARACPTLVPLMHKPRTCIRWTECFTSIVSQFQTGHACVRVESQHVFPAHPLNRVPAFKPYPHHPTDRRHQQYNASRVCPEPEGSANAVSACSARNIAGVRGVGSQGFKIPSTRRPRGNEAAVTLYKPGLGRPMGQRSSLTSMLTSTPRGLHPYLEKSRKQSRTGFNRHWRGRTPRFARRR